MPTSWAQKRAQIAQALQGGGGGLSIGAGITANPMLGGQGAGGLFGGGQQMAQANASLQGAPGFDYVPPAVGPPPAPATAAGQGGPLSPMDMNSMLKSGLAIFAPPAQKEQMSKWYGGSGGRNR